MENFSNDGKNKKIKTKGLERKLWILGKCLNFNAFIILLIVCVGMAVMMFGVMFDRNGAGIPVRIIGSAAVAVGTGAFIGIFLHIFNVKPLPNEIKLNRIRGKLAKNFVLCVVSCAAFTAFSIYVGPNAWYLAESYIKFFIVCVFVVFIGGSVSSLLLMFFNKSVKRKYSNNGGINLINEAAKASAEKLCRQAEIYDAARTEKRAEAGKLPKTSLEYSRERGLKKAAYVAGDLLLVVIIFLFAAFYNGNIYTVESIERLHVDDDIAHIEMMIGSPYDKKDIQNPNGNIIGGTWSWCSHGNAAKIAAKNKQLEKLTENADDFNFSDLEKITKLSEEIMALELELSMTACDYIYVTYGKNGYVGDTRVTSILFYKNCRGRPDPNRKVSKITYAAKEIIACKTQADGVYYDYDQYLSVNYSDELVLEREKVFTVKNSEGDTGVIDEIAVRIYFSDGGIENKSVALDYNLSTDAEQTSVWHDAYGEHELKIRLI